MEERDDDLDDLGSEDSGVVGEEGGVRSVSDIVENFWVRGQANGPESNL